MSPSEVRRIERLLRAILPIVYTVFCATFSAAIMASGDGKEDGASVPGHTVKKMVEKVCPINEERCRVVA